MNTLTKWNPFRKANGGESVGPLTRWNVAKELEQFENRMDQLFRNWPILAEINEPLAVADWTPPVDITEDDKEYLVKAELPEVRKEDLKVKVEDNVLTITGERKSEKEEKGKKYHRIERSYGSFERSFTLPDDADATKVTSEFKDGVLLVHLAKNPGAKPKAIEVKVQ